MGKLREVKGNKSTIIRCSFTKETSGFCSRYKDCKMCEFTPKDDDIGSGTDAPSNVVHV